MSDVATKTKDELRDMGLSNDGINYIFDNLCIDPETIHKNIEYVRNMLSRNNSIRNVASYLYTAVIGNYAGKTHEASKKATETYIKRENQVSNNENLKRTQALVKVHKKEVDSLIRVHLQDKQPKMIVQTYVLSDSGPFFQDYIKRHINIETVTTDELLGDKMIYAAIQSHILKNNLVQMESLEDFLKHKGETIDQLVLLNNALI
jgi:hypothetical protein